MSNQSSALLINEEPLQLLPSLALAITIEAERIDVNVTGLNEALVLQQLHYWLRKPKMGVLRDGRKWIYNSYPEWKENFPFWSERTILRIFTNLEDLGLVDSTQPGGRDRRKQYAINYDALNALISSVESASEIDSHTHGCQPETATRAETSHADKLSLSDPPSCQDASRQVVGMDNDKASPPSGQHGTILIKVSETTPENTQRTHTPAMFRAPSNGNGRNVCVCSTSHKSKLCDDERIRIARNIPGVVSPESYAMTPEARRGTYDAVYLSHRKTLQRREQPGAPERDTSACPDCHGRGLWYPAGADTPEGRARGTAKCKHPRLDGDGLYGASTESAGAHTLHAATTDDNSVT